MITINLFDVRVWASEKVTKKINLVPAVFLKWPENGPEHAIIVDKSLQKIYVYKKGSPPNKVVTYNCSTGENDGPKMRQNDKRTPEGIYYITKSFAERELSPIYGVRAFPLDYPNSLDLKEGRQGYGIWFHGTNKPLKPNDTNGCIALENVDIEQMAAFVRLDETPIIISRKLVMGSPVQIEQDKMELEDIIEKWRIAWEEKDINRYMSYYSPSFSSGGKNWQEWRDYKARLADKYKSMSIKISDSLLLTNGETALASFTQQYETRGLKSIGRKRLYLKRNSKEWKIFAEKFYGSDVTRLASVPEKVSPQEEIERFIQSWLRSWEKKNLEAYVSCYDSSFESRDMTLKGWQQHRANLNRKYRSLNINISQIRIKILSDQRAEISFIQDYRADRYRDYGLKTMILIKEGKDWKIKKEEWSPLKKTN